MSKLKKKTSVSRITLRQVLEWADEHFERTGSWPSRKSGAVQGLENQSWDAIGDNLARGGRGLPGGTTLLRVLAEYRNVPRRLECPPLSIKKILEWADDHHDRTGQWPKVTSRAILCLNNLSWGTINNKLTKGGRNLRGGTSLARLLAKHRGVPNKLDCPRLSIEKVLEWADTFHHRTGKWPTVLSGSVKGVPQTTWLSINTALGAGGRGLPSSSSLLKVLAKCRGVRNFLSPPPLTVKQILSWIDAHHKHTGQWPTFRSGAIRGAEGEAWSGINRSLLNQKRGLNESITLLQLLIRERGVQNRKHAPNLTLKKILDWADTYYARTGTWPTKKSTYPPPAPGETWANINSVLARGIRGLTSKTTLALLLAKHRGVRHPKHPPPLSIPLILSWAETHHKHKWQWPTVHSGVIHGVSGESWSVINDNLTKEQRGLKGRTTLALLLAKHRGVRHPMFPPPLADKQILAWADNYYHQNGIWPTRRSGIIPEDPGENWCKVFDAMSHGKRGLPIHESLPKFLKTKRYPEYEQCRTPLFPDHILEWAADHQELYGKLPAKNSGPVRGMDGEHWPAIDASLRSGTRTRPGGSSLQEFLRGHYEKPWPGIGRKLTDERILKWADSFRERVGTWPTRKSAYTDPSRTERWEIVDLCLREGHRGLEGGSTLHRLLSEHRFGR